MFSWAPRGSSREAVSPCVAPAHAAVFWFTRWPLGDFSRCGLAPRPPSVPVARSRGTASGPSPAAAPRPSQAPLRAGSHRGGSWMAGRGADLFPSARSALPPLHFILSFWKRHTRTPKSGFAWLAADPRGRWTEPGPRRAGRTAPCSRPPARAGRSRPCFLLLEVQVSWLLSRLQACGGDRKQQWPDQNL